MSSLNMDYLQGAAKKGTGNVSEVTALRGPVGREETKALTQAFSNIAEKWGLSIDEQLALLGHPARSTYFKWKKEGGILPRDTQDRISYVLGIHKALRIIFPGDDAAYTWIRKPNSAPLFGGHTALDVMIERGLVGLYQVRAYLDSARGGWS